MGKSYVELVTRENNAMGSDTKAGPIQHKQKIFSRHDVQARKELSDGDPISSKTINQQNRKVRDLEGKNNGSGSGGKSKIKNADHFLFVKRNTATQKPKSEIKNGDHYLFNRRKAATKKPKPKIKNGDHYIFDNKKPATHNPESKIKNGDNYLFDKKTTATDQPKSTIKIGDHYLFENKRTTTQKPESKKKKTRKGQSQPNPQTVKGSGRKVAAAPRSDDDLNGIFNDIDVSDIDLGALDIPNPSQVSTLDDLLNYVTIDDINEMSGGYPLCQQCMDTAHIYTICMWCNLCFSYITKPSLIMVLLSLIVHYLIV